MRKEIERDAEEESEGGKENEKNVLILLVKYTDGSKVSSYLIYL